MFIVTALMLLVIFSVPAHAYIDPGSGSYMLQVTLAGVLAVIFSIKMYWQRLKTFVSSRLRSLARPRLRDRA